MRGKKTARVVRKKSRHKADTPAQDRAKAREDDVKARHHLREAGTAESRSKADTEKASKDVVTGPFERDTGAIRGAANAERLEASKEQGHAAKERADARKDFSRARAERAKARRATLGGCCAWEAFGVRRKWYQRRAVRIGTVAKLAGFIRGCAAPGAVVGVYVQDGELYGYHACRVLAAGACIIIDLYGAATAIEPELVEECWAAPRS